MFGFDIRQAQVESVIHEDGEIGAGGFWIVHLEEALRAAAAAIEAAKTNN